MGKPVDLVKLQDIQVQFANQPVLQQVNLTLHKDCITTLIGPNGAGKTTLVRVVLGLIQPNSGSVWRQSGLQVGYMPQKLQIDRTFPLTVKRFLQTVKGVSLQQMEQALGAVSAEHLLRHSLHDLSGGKHSG